MLQAAGTKERLDNHEGKGGPRRGCGHVGDGCAIMKEDTANDLGSAVDFFSVAYLHHNDEKIPVFNGIDDTVTAFADPIPGVLTR